MNTGIIADRYANAFYDYALSEGCVAHVYEQSRLILSQLGRVPDFYLALCGKLDVETDSKMELLELVVAPQTVRPEFRALLGLLRENDRSELLQLVLLDFINIYRDRNNISSLLVTTAVPGSAIADVLAKSAEKQLGRKIILQTRVDPDILGGFICQSWDFCYDASVRTALAKAHKKLTDNTINNN